MAEIDYAAIAARRAARRRQIWTTQTMERPKVLDHIVMRRDPTPADDERRGLHNGSFWITMPQATSREAMKTGGGAKVWLCTSMGNGPGQARWEPAPPETYSAPKPAKLIGR